MKRLLEKDKLFILSLEKSDISNEIRREPEKLSRECLACKKYKMSHIFYHWRGLISKMYLGLKCSPCAYREAFGNTYKRNKQYIKWKEKQNAGEKR